MLTKGQTNVPVEIYHPMIQGVYLQDDYDKNLNKQKVLVLETATEFEMTEYEGFDPYLIDLITDLEDLKNKAIKQVGHIDRIDIQSRKH